MDKKAHEALAEFTDAFTHQKPDEVPPMPKWLYKPPGAVGEIVDWMNRTAYKKQPILAVANALTFYGVVLGRKLRTESDLRTNLMCLGVAESSSGKDHSRKAIKALCEAAELTSEILGGEGVSSDAAIMTAVARRPAVLFQFDEIGHMMSAIKDRNAPAYMRNIAVLLTKLYTSSNTLYLGNEYADQKLKPRIDLNQPCVGLYGTSIGSVLYDALSPAEIRDGLLGRLFGISL